MRMEIDIENILCIGGVIGLTGAALYFGVTENAIVTLGIGVIGGYLAKSLTSNSEDAGSA